MTDTNDDNSMTLPSRFQIRDPIRVGKHNGHVHAVIFYEDKVYYHVKTAIGIIGPVDSCDVNEPLEVVS